MASDDDNEPLDLSYFNPKNFYEISKVNQTVSRKFNCAAFEYKITFKNLHKIALTEAHETFLKILQSIIDTIVETSHGYTNVRFCVRSDQIENAINLKFMALNELSAERLMGAISQVSQSRRNFFLEGDIRIDAIFLKTNISISGRRSVRNRSMIELDKYIQKGRTFIPINNDDDLCVARSIVCGIMVADLTYLKQQKLNTETFDFKRYRAIQDGQRPLQKKGL